MLVPLGHLGWFWLVILHDPVVQPRKMKRYGRTFCTHAQRPSRLAAVGEEIITSYSWPVASNAQPRVCRTRGRQPACGRDDEVQQIRPCPCQSFFSLQVLFVHVPLISIYRINQSLLKDASNKCDYSTSAKGQRVQQLKGVITSDSCLWGTLSMAFFRGEDAKVTPGSWQETSGNAAWALDCPVRAAGRNEEVRLRVL